MKDQIIQKICAIPLHKWDAYTTELNGVKITLNPAHTNFSPFLEIGDLKFYGTDVNVLKYKLQEYQKINKDSLEEQNLVDIYKKLML